MLEGHETPPPSGEKRSGRIFSGFKEKVRKILQPPGTTRSTRETTLEEQLKAARMNTAEPPLTTAEHARRHRAEQIRQQQKELARLREEHGSEPHWGNIEEITYRELVENGKLKEAERYREVILREIKNKKKKE